MRIFTSLVIGALLFVSAAGFSQQKTIPLNQYVATAYCLKGRTASGRKVARGIVAADPRIHRLGSRIWLHAGPYSGQYIVADTGGKIKGRRLDIWVPTKREAMAFGKRKVHVSF